MQNRQYYGAAAERMYATFVDSQLFSKSFCRDYVGFQNHFVGITSTCVNRASIRQKVFMQVHGEPIKHSLKDCNTNLIHPGLNRKPV